MGEWVSVCECEWVQFIKARQRPVARFPLFPAFAIRQWLSVSVSVAVEVRNSFGPARPAPAPAPGPAAVPVSVCAILFLCANHAASLNLFAVWGMWLLLSLCFCLRCRCRFSRFSVFHFAFTFAFVFLARTVLSGFSFLFTGIYGFQRWFCLVFFMCF